MSRGESAAAQGQRECVVCGQPLTPGGKCPRPQETLCTMTDEGPEVSSAAKPPVNELAVALAVREAMREHRKDKPTVFDPGYWPKRWSDPTYLGDGPWGA